ncbi:MAG TPA: hypothetical protein VK281_15340 [Xanthobacteraceae bacterium]|nr:hypothetical protein [Xanthobacteraceae bacterium]
MTPLADFAPWTFELAGRAGTVRRFAAAAPTKARCLRCRRRVIRAVGANTGSGLRCAA